MSLIQITIVGVWLMVAYLVIRSFKNEGYRGEKPSWRSFLKDMRVEFKQNGIGQFVSVGMSVGIMVLSMVSVIWGIICVPAVLILRYKYDITEEVTYTQDIASLNQGDNLSGSFFLGSGSIDQTPYYFYFVKCKDGSYIRNQVVASKTYIHENENENPCLKWTVTRNEVPKWLKTGISDVYDDEASSYHLYVPANTIIKEFTVR